MPLPEKEEDSDLIYEYRSFLFFLFKLRGVFYLLINKKLIF